MCSKFIKREFKSVKLYQTNVAKHKGILRKVSDKRVLYSATNRLIKQRGRL